MFDLRYHVASLAAVFFALVIGILVGVALASHGLGHAERQRLERDLHLAQRQNQDLQQTVQAYQADAAFVGSAYSAVMTGRLTGLHIAVLFIGSSDRKVRAAVNGAVADGGGTISRVRVISVPIDRRAVIRAIVRHRSLQPFAKGAQRFTHIGTELADEFVVGGDTPMWDALESDLVEERSGSGRVPVDALVVVRSAAPQTDLATARFLSGLLSELASRPLPVIGVERKGTDPSAIPTFTRFGLSTVSDVDLPIGKVALAVLLSTPDPGNQHYGLRPHEDVLPQIPPVATNTQTTSG